MLSNKKEKKPNNKYPFMHWQLADLKEEKSRIVKKLFITP